MPDLNDLLNQTSALHDHICPRQVLGVRTGILAARLFDLDLPQTDKRLYAFVETDGCYVDGVIVSTGCRIGRRTLRLLDYGKVAATFVDSYTGKALRISPHSDARTRACAYAPAAPDHWHAQLHAYRTMPDADLLQVQAVQLTLSLEALISRPGLRVPCTLCGEEIMNAREVLRDGLAYCRRCAGLDTYYNFDAHIPVPDCSPTEHSWPLTSE